MEATATPRPRRFAPVAPRALRLASDERLVEHVRAGSEPAFEALYERHHRQILAFCRHMLGSAHEAEDAVQHTFLSAYRNLVGSDKPIQLRAWLYAIARNRCLSILRARRDRPASDEEAPMPATEGLAEEVQRREDLRELLVDLRGLPDDQRAALLLAELGDLSHVEIADALGCRTEKVKGLIFQARRALAAGRGAREIPCAEIRHQLATAAGGALRRAPLRRHLRDCEGCREFRDEVQRQRAAFALVLPVVPTAALKAGALPWLAGAAGGGGAASAAGGAGAAGAAVAGGGGAAAGAGGGVAAAGGAAATGAAMTGGAAATSSGGAALLAGGTVAKVLAIAAVAVGGTAGGAATISKLRGPDESATPDRSRVEQPAKPGARTPSVNASPTAKTTSPPQSIKAQGVMPARRAGAGGNRERARQRRRDRELERGKQKGSSLGPGRSGSAPGRSKEEAAGGGNGNDNGKGQGNGGRGGSSQPQGAGQVGDNPGRGNGGGAGNGNGNGGSGKPKVTGKGGANAGGQGGGRSKSGGGGGSGEADPRPTGAEPGKGGASGGESGGE